METIAAPVVIVSAFGRGHWMAVELQSVGMDVILLDISEQMGAWAPEDWEGPFGFFKTDNLSSKQWDRLNQDEVPLLASKGLTFWFQDGPLEIQGPVNKYRLKNYGFDIQKINQPAFWAKLKFEDRWFYELLCALASPIHSHNPFYSSVTDPIEASQSLYVRNATRKGWLQSIEWVRSKEVTVLDKIQLTDVAMSDRLQVDGVEIKKERSEFLKVDQLVWCLNSEETKFVSPQAQSVFFPKGVIESEWCWLRFRVKVKESFRRDQLPLHFTIVLDPYLPWCHENLLVVQRTASHGFFDCWMKLPTEQRFNKQYLIECGESLVRVLKERFIEDEISVQNYPQEYNYIYAQMGPPRFPVYSRESCKKFGPQKISNLFLDSSEQWSWLNWNGQFKNQTKLVNELKNWWRRKEEIRLRQESKKTTRKSKQEKEL